MSTATIPEVRDVDTGDLWKAVVNSLGDAPVTVDVYLPILRLVAARWRKWTYFLGRVAAHFDDAKDVAELEGDLGRARLGVRIWDERREPLRHWANAQGDKQIGEDELRAWWFEDERIADLDRYERRGQEMDLPKALGFDDADWAIMDVHPEIPVWEPKTHFNDYWLRENLVWISELEMLRTLAGKTWPADVRDRRPWTQDELDWVNRYYEEQRPELYVPGDPSTIDPFELEILNDEQNLGAGLDGLRYCMYVLMRAVVADLVDEIIDVRRRGLARGSLRCVECGLFVGRRALGYGQLYCTDTCKKRAAKRRYRGRLREARTGPKLRVVP